jgi:rSAM/selenodomain-associated transferase 2
LRLSIIVPVLDEAAGIADNLAQLTGLRRAGCEVIVVDGGSGDDTTGRAAPWCDRLISAPRGRAAQMNAGAAVARTGLLLFLHADTRLPPGALDAIEAATRDRSLAWGRFDVTLDSRRGSLRMVGAMMSLRSRLTGIATGDQALFMTRGAFEAVGGFPPIALMEDVAISGALKRLARPHCLRLRVTTSARRWETRGVIATIVLMWRLRLAYFLGAAPEGLARRYR